jgi:3-deoxy-7-phosphoheptulonate synthase
VYPYTFQGNGEEGLKMFRKAADKYNLRIVTELMDARMLDTFLKYDVDVIQIGTRSMQNFELLKEVGRINKPVILKRGMSATISEWLMAAEYIAAGGNHNIIFCERGIRTFETAYRNVMDVTCVEKRNPFAGYCRSFPCRRQGVDGSCAGARCDCRRR